MNATGSHVSASFSGQAESAQLSHARSDLIEPGHTTLLRLPNGEVRSIKLDGHSNISLGRFGSFAANELIGQSYGLSFEIDNKKLKLMRPPTIQDLEDTEATNELINDGQFVQPLTSEEIDTLKKSGVHASEIIKKQVEMHATYALKTEYSKEKYKKRKEAKYGKYFTVVEPTLFNICEYWFAKDKTRTREIRIDTLSQMITLCNIRPDGRYLVVDDAGGMVVSAVLDRIGASGRIFTICDVDSPPTYPVLTHMNYPKNVLDSVISSLNWLTLEEDYIPVASEDHASQAKSEKQKSRLNKRKAAADTLQGLREELYAGGFDGLLVASEYDPLSIMDKLSPYLAGSASIVVHNPYMQILADLQGELRGKPQYLGPTVSESWTRRYQVLPGRTHPFMTTSGSGGFLLHTIKVYDDPSANSIMAYRVKNKRVKVLEEITTESSRSGTPLSEGSNTAFQAHSLSVSAADIQDR